MTDDFIEEDMEMSENGEPNPLSLVYVKLIGVNGNGENEYEAYFSDVPDTIWNESWAEQVPSICGDISPTEGVVKVCKITTRHTFSCAQDNNCFSMQDCIDGIIKLVWIEDGGRILMKSDFGEAYDEFERKLNGLGIKMTDNGDR